MAKDFRAKRVRTSVIVGSGSAAFNKPTLGLLIYSGSQAADWKGGYKDAQMLENVGTDVWMVVSGSTNNSAYKNSQKADGSSVLFLGDVVISGSLWAERSIIEVDETVPGNFRAPNAIIAGFGDADAAGSTALFLSDPTTPTGGSNGAGTISFKKVGASTGAFTYPNTNNRDVFFHVSGSRGVKNSNDRGVALFDGDVMVSGNLEIGPSSTFTIPGDFTIGGDLTVAGNDILGSAGQAIEFETPSPNVHIRKGLKVGNNAITGSDGNTQVFLSGSATGIGIEGALQISGNKIKNARGVDTITLDNSSDVTVANDLIVAGNGIKSSAGTTAITLSGVSATIAGDLRVNGNDIKDSSGNAAVSFDGSQNTQLKGTLQVDGNEIKDSGGARVLFLSGSGHAAFDKNLTVGGDLHISGSLTSIGTENLRVKDAVILLASGSTSTHTKGGIAIASGSSVSNIALTFGTAGGTSAPGSFRAGYMDVSDGSVTNFDTAQPVEIQLAGIRFKNRTNANFNNTFVSASINTTTNETELNVHNSDGPIFLSSLTRGVHLTENQKIVFDGQGGVEKTSIRFQNKDLVLAHLNAGDPVDGGAVLIEPSSAAGGIAAKLEFRNSSNYIYAHDQSAGLYVTGSGLIQLGAEQSAGESGLILSASSQEPVGGPVLVISASDQFNGSTREGYISVGAALSELPSLFTSSRHRDVRVLLSGSAASANTNTRGVTLVGGDLVVSGNTDFKGAVDIGALSTNNLVLNSTTADEPYLRFRDNTVQLNRRNDGALLFKDSDLGVTKTLRDLASLSVVDNTDVFTISHGTPSHIKTTGSFSFDTSDRYTTDVGTDSYFFVSGSIGSKDYSTRPGNGERGTAVFGGDIHISGSLFADQPTFWTSLHTAYSTPDTVGIKSFSDLSAGAGAVIDTSRSGIPLQLRNPATATAPGVNDSSAAVLTVTGSMGFEYSGGGNASRLHMQSQNAFEFHNSDGEVFRLVAGTGATNTHARFPGTNQLRFSDDSRYIYAHTADTIKRITVANTSAGGIVAVNAGAGAGHLAVTGSVLPGADNSYNLGSPSMRWANVYTGDLHLRNERGNWTIYEEPDMLVVVNNLTGKKYKMGLTPLEDEE